VADNESFKVTMTATADSDLSEDGVAQIEVNLLPLSRIESSSLLPGDDFKAAKTKIPMMQRCQGAQRSWATEAFTGKGNVPLALCNTAHDLHCCVFYDSDSWQINFSLMLEFTSVN